MHCPFCKHDDTQVKDSRPSDDGSSIRRRRHCPKCGARFTTFERVQLRELMVLKTSGERKAFDRDKVTRSMKVALRKRPVDEETLEMAINRIVKKLEGEGEGDIPSKRIGELVMEELRGLDGIAYVRYASVYRDFDEMRDFGIFVETESLGK